MAGKKQLDVDVKRVEVYFLDPHCETGWSAGNLSLDDSLCFIDCVELERTDEHYIVAQGGGVKDTLTNELLNRFIIPWDHVIQINKLNKGRVEYRKKDGGR